MVNQIFNKILMDKVISDLGNQWLPNWGPLDAFKKNSKLDIAKYLTENECKTVTKNILELLRYLLDNDKFVFASSINDGYIHRAGKIRSGDRGNGFFPISKSKSSSCSSPATYVEPIWFGFKALPVYMNLKPDDPYGLITCRQIRTYSTDEKPILVVNLSVSANPSCNPKTYFIDKYLQTCINKAILIIHLSGFGRICKLRLNTIDACFQFNSG